jgi:hypothetical protein
MSFDFSTAPPRRQFLQAMAAPALGLSLTPLRAQPTGGRNAVSLVQLLDMSAAQQELSRDYATGLRLAWATEIDVRRSSGQGGPRISLRSITTDGSRSGLQEALQTVQQDPGVIGLVGSCGDALAVQAQAELRRLGLRLPHLAPWMADSRHDGEGGLACLFASRQIQLQQAMSSVRGMGVDELCVLFSSAVEQGLYEEQVASMAQLLGLRLKRLTGDSAGGVPALAARIPSTSAMVLCLGTSAELALLTQAMSSRGDRRFVVGLGDVDAPSLQQLAPGAGVPVILTQVVPNPFRSPLPLVTEYRQQLKRLFDEAPSPISLAGYIAGLYVAELLKDAGSQPSRESLLGQIQRRNSQNLGGWRVDFRDDRRGSRYVTQTMIGRGGQLIG